MMELSALLPWIRQYVFSLAIRFSISLAISTLSQLLEPSSDFLSTTTSHRPFASPQIPPRGHIAPRTEDAEIPAGIPTKFGIYLENDPIQHRSYLLYYRREDGIGRGHDGTVYRGKMWDKGHYGPEEKKTRNHSKAVALKETHDDGVQPILRANSVQSPFLLPLITYYRVGNRNRNGERSIWLVTSLWDTDLFALQRSGTIPSQQIFFFFRQLLQGIESLHAANIVHRDIWAGNVLVNVQKDASGQVVGIKEVTWTDFASVTIAGGHEHRLFLHDSYALGRLLVTLLSPIHSMGDLKNLPVFKEIPRTTTQKQVAEALERHYGCMSEQLRDLLSKVLCVETEGRIGVKEFRNGYEKTPEYLN